MQADRADQVSLLDEWEAKLSASERAKQPWTRATLDQFNGLATILHSLPVLSEKDPLRARNDDLLRRTERLLPVADDSEWALASKACASATTIQDCEAVSDYLKKPKARHLAEAKALATSPRVQALAKKELDARARETQDRADNRRQQCNVCVGQCVARRAGNTWNPSDACRTGECRDLCE